MRKFKTYAEYLWRKDTETGIDLTTGEEETMTKSIDEWQLVDWAEFFNGFHEQTEADAGICLFCRHNAVMRDGVWYCNHNERN